METPVTTVSADADALLHIADSPSTAPVRAVTDDYTIKFISSHLPVGEMYNYEYVFAELLHPPNPKWFDVELLCSLRTEKDTKLWVQAFEEKTKTSFSIRTSTRGGSKWVLNQRLVCHHNTRSSKTNARSFSCKNTNCPATLSIRIAKLFPYEGNSRPCHISISFIHNHGIGTADVMRFRRVKQDIKDKFLEMYRQKHNPASAMKQHKADLVRLYGDAAPDIISDRSQCPDISWATNLFRNQRKSLNTATKTEKLEAEENVQAESQPVEDSATASDVGSPTAAAAAASASVNATLEKLKCFHDKMCAKVSEEPSKYIPAVECMMETFSKLESSNKLVDSLYSFGNTNMPQYEMSVQLPSSTTVAVPTISRVPQNVTLPQQHELPQTVATLPEFSRQATASSCFLPSYVCCSNYESEQVSHHEAFNLLPQQQLQIGVGDGQMIAAAQPSFPDPSQAITLVPMSTSTVTAVEEYLPAPRSVQHYPPTSTSMSYIQQLAPAPAQQITVLSSHVGNEEKSTARVKKRKAERVRKAKSAPVPVKSRLSLQERRIQKARVNGYNMLVRDLLSNSQSQSAGLNVCNMAKVAANRWNNLGSEQRNLYSQKALKETLDRQEQAKQCVREKEPDKFVYRCQKCLSDFVSVSALVRHKQQECSGVPGNQQQRQICSCPECGKLMRTRSSLARHIAVLHNKQKKFACTHCGKKFSCRTDVQIHVRVHTKETPYSCQICGKRFTTASNLRRHLAIHLLQLKKKFPKVEVSPAVSATEFWHQLNSEQRTSFKQKIVQQKTTNVEVI